MNDLTTAADVLEAHGARVCGVRPGQKNPWTTRPRASGTTSWSKHHEEGYLAEGRKALGREGVQLGTWPGMLELATNVRGVGVDLDRLPPEGEANDYWLLAINAATGAVPFFVASKGGDEPHKHHAWYAVRGKGGREKDRPFLIAGGDEKPVGDLRCTTQGKTVLRCYPDEAVAVAEAIRNGAWNAVDAEQFFTALPPRRSKLLERSLAEVRDAAPGERNHSLGPATTRLVSGGEDTPEARRALKDAYLQINPDDAPDAVDHAFATATARLTGNPYRQDPARPVLSHLDLAIAFDERGFADQWRWVDEQAGWRHWHEGKWVTDEAKSLTYELLDFGQRVVMTHNRQGELVPAPVKGGSTPFAANARVALAGRPRMKTRLDDWDASSDWAGAPDGHMLNLRTGEVRPACPDDLVTRRLGTLPGDTGRDVWEKFLTETLPDEAERAYFMRMMGLALSGRGTDAQTAIFVTGVDASGKSLLLDTIGCVFGDFAVTAPPELIFNTGVHTTAFRLDNLIGSCAGARLIIAGDPPEGARWNTGSFKQLTGDHHVSGRQGNRIFPIRRSWVMTCATNHLPGSPSSSVLRRIALVQAPHHHEDPEKGGDFPAKDPTLPARLRAAAPAILSDLLAEAFEKIPSPPVTTYGFAKIEAGNGDFRLFIADCIDRIDGVKTDERLVMAAYNAWRSSSDRDAPKLSLRGLREVMLTQGGFAHVRPKPVGGGPRPYMFEGAHLTFSP